MFIKNVNLILTVSALTLSVATACQASNPNCEDLAPAPQKSPTQTLDAETIKSLTPINPILVTLAKQGNPEAINRLGVCLLRGVGCRQNTAKAFQCFTKAAQLNHPAGLMNLAGALTHGDGCEKSDANDRRAFECFKKAGELGNEDGKFAYADHLLHGKFCEVSRANQDRGWKIMRELAKNDHPGAMYKIGVGFLEGEDRTAADHKEGVKWLKKSAALDDRDALGKLGTCYLMGTGCEQNNDEAFKCFKAAADLGHKPSMANLSLCLQHGLGCERTPENQALAIRTYKKLAKMGDTTSMMNLAFAFDSGNGVEKNLEQAQFWYEKAAQTGYDSPLYNLALFYFHNKKFDLALPCFERVKTKYKVADFLGYIYFMKKNYEQALLNYEAANNEGTEAHYNIGANNVKAAKNINATLLEYLRNKVKEAKAISQPLPKSETINVAKEQAVEAQEKELASLLRDTESQQARLIQKLEGIKNPDFDSAQELEGLKKTYTMATSNLDGLDRLKKLARLKMLSQYLAGLEARIMVFEHKLESDKKLAQLRQQALGGSKPLYEPGMETSNDRNIEKKEVKEAAAKAISNEKDLKHKKANRPHDPKPRGKVIAKPSSQKEAEPEKRETPFSKMQKPEKRTKAQLPDAAWNNVYKIRDTLREAQSMEDAIGSLKQIPGDFDFKDVSADYAGVPHDCKAFEMRINGQYRVIIAFQPVKEKVYETSSDGQNNNNPIEERIVYKLYGDRIYIDDPHKG